MRPFAPHADILIALQPTPYKADISLTDLDRGVYETLRLTVARHPSETEERLAVRLLAYVLWYGEQIAFGRGLSDVDEPTLWEKSLDGRVLYWIEVGQPDAERITWCSCHCERFSLFAYGSLWVWQTKVLDSVRSLESISVAAVPQKPLESLSRGLPRSINWTVMISEGTLFVTDENGQHELQLGWLQGERWSPPPFPSVEPNE